MKKLLNLIVCMTAIWALSSCDFLGGEKSSKEPEKVKTIVELPDSVKQKIVKQDALMKELLNKVDTLTAELNSAKAENAELKKKVAELETPQSTWAYVSIVAFILGLVALIVAFLGFRGIKEKRVIDIFERCISGSGRIKELQFDVHNLLSSQRNNITSGSSYASNSDARLRQLENQMKQVIEAVNQMKNSKHQSVSSLQEKSKSHEKSEYQKVGYAKVDTDIYFMTIYDSNQEGCVFKISFTSQTQGRFNIITLDKILSRNDWQKKVECCGVSIKEASDFRVEEEGECEKIDENTWEVVKPLRIKLLK